MTAERWQQIEALYHAARERGPVALEGSDAALRAEVEALLAQDDTGQGGILDQPAAEFLDGLSGSSFVPGTQLGPYRIEGLIGKGGMGEVFLGHDLRLNRPVAIKMVAQKFSRRFESEARAIAAVNHSNICTLYDIGPNYLVMELVEGPALAELIAQGPLPLEAFLPIATQIAAALEAAHEKRIVHRDLKPANIKIKPDGSVKVLDFGLAKTVTEGALVAVPGATSLSIPGTVLGTPKYMSPEQIRGMAVDARADIWAFGVVLYEMATGKLPFNGDSLAAIMTSILRDWPEPATKLNRTLPAEFGRIVDKALEKECSLRYQRVSDLRGDLMRLDQETKQTVAGPALLDKLRITGRRRISLLFAVLLAVATTVFAAFFFSSPVPSPRVLNTFQITNDRRPKTGPFVTDGSRVYFNSGVLENQPYEVSVKGGDSFMVSTQLANARVLDISPDHSELLIRAYDAAGVPFEWVTMPLLTAATIGGYPRRIGNLAGTDASWSRDGQRIVVAREGELDIASRDGSIVKRLVKVSRIPYAPRWSPDGNTIRFTLANDIPTNGVDASSALWEVQSDGSNLHPVFPDWPQPHCCGNWTPDGKYFVFTNVVRGLETVWSVREKNSLFSRVKREPVELASGPISLYAPVPSLDGKRLFVGGHQRRSEIVRYDARAKALIPFLPGLSIEGLDFSRDGNWVTYVSYPEGILWRSTIDGQQRLQLTQAPMRANLPRWAPDGKTIAFMGQTPGQPSKIFLISAKGGASEALTSGALSTGFDPSWSPDGKLLAISGDEAERVRIHILNLATRQLSVLPASVGRGAPRWSPDGHYIAALSYSSAQLFLFDLKAGKWMAGLQENFGYPSWSRDSQYIYFDTFGSEPAFKRVRIRDQKVEQILRLKDMPRALGAFGFWSGLAPDGSALLQRDVSLEEIYALECDFP